jgi:hypothetical protein
MMDTRDDRAQAGPTDREVVALLQRLASARAQLLQAEQAAEQAAPVSEQAAQRNPDIESAHTELLWAQAQLITANRETRAQRALEQAQTRERQALRRYGYSTFRDYLSERTSIPTTDVHLEVARTEFASARADWDAIQQELAATRDTDDGSTVVIDLTGDEPRRIA